MSATSLVKTSLGLGLLLFAGVLALQPKPAHAAGYDICPSGCTYSTIQAGVNATPAWAGLTVGPGVYNESVSLPRPITLSGPKAGFNATRAFDPNNEAVVTGRLTDGSGYKTAFQVLSPNVTLDGFTIGGPSASDPNYYSGINVLGGSTGFHLTSTIIRNQVYGVIVHASNSISFGNDRFDADLIGIHAMNVTNAYVGTEAPVIFTGPGRYLSTPVTT